MIEIPIIDVEKTGKNIKELRIKSGLSVKDLQNIFDFSSPQAIYKWETGKSLPTIDNLLILSKIFNVIIEDILVTKNE